MYMNDIYDIYKFRDYRMMSGVLVLIGLGLPAGALRTESPTT